MVAVADNLLTTGGIAKLGSILSTCRALTSLDVSGELFLKTVWSVVVMATIMLLDTWMEHRLLIMASRVLMQGSSWERDG